MAIGPTSPSPNTPIDDTELDAFLHTNIPNEEWQKRINVLKKLVNSIPDYSTTTAAAGRLTPWYRSSKYVRRLCPGLKPYILDARSAVVKEGTELIGTLLMVKLQHHPNADEDNGDIPQSHEEKRPPPPFVGRLLFKDLLPLLLQLSSQTVKVIRSYGTSLVLDVLPHCRVPSSLVLLCERLKSDKNRGVKEDCARYLRCVLETWPCDDALKNSIAVYMEANGGTDDNDVKTVIRRFRRDECLTTETVKQIGSELGRSLSDPAQPVRNESRLGFQVLFRRFRPIWDEVMRINSGVVRDVRLRKKLLEAAARSDGRDVEDLASLDEGSIGGVSYGSMRSGISQLTFRSYASRGTRTNAVPDTIKTPKTRATVMHASREAISNYSPNTYVTSGGQVFSTPSPRTTFSSSRQRRTSSPVILTKQPFASLLETPKRSPVTQLSPLGLSSNKTQKASCAVLRKRLSSRISGVGALNGNDKPLYSNGKKKEEYGRQLSSIQEKDDNKGGASKANNSTVEEEVPEITTPELSEITTVALEVIRAHLFHLKQFEEAMSQEKKILTDLENLSGTSIVDHDLISSEVTKCLASLSEEQVLDYFESLHVCVNKQLVSSEAFMGEMEKISQGDENGNDISDMATSPDSLAGGYLGINNHFD